MDVMVSTSEKVEGGAEPPRRLRTPDPSDGRRQGRPRPRLGRSRPPGSQNPMGGWIRPVWGVKIGVIKEVGET